MGKAAWRRERNRMSVFLRVDINLMAILILGLIIVIAGKRLDMKDPLNAGFKNIAVAIIIQLFLETSTCVINKRPELWLIPLSYLLHVCLFSVSAVLTYYWYGLIRGFVRPERSAVGIRVLFLLPLFANTLLSVLSPVTGSVFSIDSENVYHRGPLYLVSTALAYFYLAAALILIIKHRKGISREDLGLLGAFSALPFAGGILQTFVYGLLLTWSSVAFSLVIVYVFLENRMVHLDYLTGAWSRGSFDYYINQKIKKDGDKKFGFVFADIDGLKKINDTYGHKEGDCALKKAIDIMRSTIRKNDIIVRYGGDEFGIVFDCESAEVVDKTIERLETAFREYNMSSAKDYKLECSFGAGIYDGDFHSIEQFLHYVDAIMYEKKNLKKNNASIP